MLLQEKQSESMASAKRVHSTSLAPLAGPHASNYERCALNHTIKTETCTTMGPYKQHVAGHIA